VNGTSKYSDLADLIGKVDSWGVGLLNRANCEASEAPIYECDKEPLYVRREILGSESELFLRIITCPFPWPDDARCRQFSVYRSRASALGAAVESSGSGDVELLCGFGKGGSLVWLLYYAKVLAALAHVVEAPARPRHQSLPKAV
jgi:hypothetical protein